MPRLRTLLLASTVALAVPTIAHADIITALSGGPVAVSGGYAYTYNVQLSGGQLDPANGTDRDGNPVAMQFGTIYDFGTVLENMDGSKRITVTGLIASDFFWTFNNTDTPPAQTAPTDNAGLTNIRFIYQGTQGVAVDTNPNTFGASGTPYTTVSGADEANLGTFTVVSPFGPTLNTSVQYDGVSYKGTNNTMQQNLGLTSGPQVPADVPEPATMALLGAGLLAIGVSRRRSAQLSA